MHGIASRNETRRRGCQQQRHPFLSYPHDGDRAWAQTIPPRQSASVSRNPARSARHSALRDVVHEVNVQTRRLQWHSGTHQLGGDTFMLSKQRRRGNEFSTASCSLQNTQWCAQFFGTNREKWSGRLAFRAYFFFFFFLPLVVLICALKITISTTSHLR